MNKKIIGLAGLASLVMYQVDAMENKSLWQRITDYWNQPRADYFGSMPTKPSEYPVYPAKPEVIHFNDVISDFKHTPNYKLAPHDTKWFRPLYTHKLTKYPFNTPSAEEAYGYDYYIDKNRPSKDASHELPSSLYYNLESDPSKINEHIEDTKENIEALSSMLHRSIENLENLEKEKNNRWLYFWYSNPSRVETLQGSPRDAVLQQIRQDNLNQHLRNLQNYQQTKREYDRYQRALAREQAAETIPYDPYE